VKGTLSAADIKNVDLKIGKGWDEQLPGIFKISKSEKIYVTHFEPDLGSTYSPDGIAQSDSSSPEGVAQSDSSVCQK